MSTQIFKYNEYLDNQGLNRFITKSEYGYDIKDKVSIDNNRKNYDLGLFKLRTSYEDGIHNNMNNS